MNWLQAIMVHCLHSSSTQKQLCILFLPTLLNSIFEKKLLFALNNLQCSSTLQTFSALYAIQAYCVLFIIRNQPDSQHHPLTALRPFGSVLISVYKALSRQWVQTQLSYMGGRLHLSHILLITFLAMRLVPSYTAWWQRHVCVNNLSSPIRQATATAPSPHNTVYCKLTSSSRYSSW